MSEESPRLLRKRGYLSACFGGQELPPAGEKFEGGKRTYYLDYTLKKPNSVWDGPYMVYRVKDSKGKLYVIKTGATVAADLTKEASILRDKTKDFVEYVNHGHPFLVSRFIQGEPLADVVVQAAKDKNNGRLHELFQGGLASLRKLHSKGVLHGDTHLENILVNKKDYHWIDFDRSELIKDIPEGSRENAIQSDIDLYIERFERAIQERYPDYQLEFDDQGQPIFNFE